MASNSDTSEIKVEGELDDGVGLYIRPSKKKVIIIY